MNTLPLQFLMLIFAGWVNRHQEDVIEYLQEENRALREQLGALVHESETSRRILRFGNLVQASIARDSGRPSSVIRFRMLHAISASASCDLG